ncbi:MAG: hypothetical protein KGZ75_06860, partial [Syntrophomonadaceae bacterium]|nr:hypothetical protein [Syntrophomonadaceae bacterium]
MRTLVPYGFRTAIKNRLLLGCGPNHLGYILPFPSRGGVVRSTGVVIPLPWRGGAKHRGGYSPPVEGWCEAPGW